MILEGEGANGKSVFTKVVVALLGRGNVSHVPLEIFGQRFALAPTLGKLANISGEIGELDSVAEGQLKAFVAGDSMQFERKYREPIMAEPTARLILATNNRPRFVDRSEGLWRRMLLVPWNVQIPEDKQDPELAKRIMPNPHPTPYFSNSCPHFFRSKSSGPYLNIPTPRTDRKNKCFVIQGSLGFWRRVCDGSNRRLCMLG